MWTDFLSKLRVGAEDKIVRLLIEKFIRKMWKDSNENIDTFIENCIKLVTDE